MVIYTSNYTAGETVTGLQDQVNAIGKVAATVDFAATGQSIGQQLGPTTVILGGNPKAGTPCWPRIRAPQFVNRYRPPRS